MDPLTTFVNARTAELRHVAADIHRDRDIRAAAGPSAPARPAPDGGATATASSGPASFTRPAVLPAAEGSVPCSEPSPKRPVHRAA
jgi:hypothetical protein